MDCVHFSNQEKLLAITLYYFVIISHITYSCYGACAAQSFFSKHSALLS